MEDNTKTVVPTALLEQIETMLLRAAAVVNEAGDTRLSTDLDALALKVRLALLPGPSSIEG